MQLNNSLDWQQLEIELSRKILDLGYNRDLNRIFANIKTMVTMLSQLEVEARRLKNDYIVQDQLTKINESIKQLNKYIVLLKLSKSE
jgi:hypothetical protein